MFRKNASLLKRVLLILASTYITVRGKLILLAGYKGEILIPLMREYVATVYTKEDWDTFIDIFIYQPYRKMKYRDATVLDIGAHRGYFVLYCLLRDARRVVCFEFDKTNLDCLAKTIAVNSLNDRVEVVPKALSDRSGTIAMNVYGESWSHSSIDRNDKAPIGRNEIDAVTLSEAVSDLGGDGMIVKSNCEGGECSIFEQIPIEIGEAIVAYHPYAPCSQAQLETRFKQAEFSVKLLKNTKAHIYLHFERG